MTRRTAVASKQGTRKAPSMKIKKGDHVIVIAGKDSGREGTVILADPKRQKVLVQGVNMIRKNTKVDYQGRRGAKEGGIVRRPSSRRAAAATPRQRRRRAAGRPRQRRRPGCGSATGTRSRPRSARNSATPT